MAEAALKKGSHAFAFFKYFELLFNSFPHSFVNSLYLLEMYKEEVLPLVEGSWQPDVLAQNKVYQQLRKAGIVPDVSTFLL